MLFPTQGSQIPWNFLGGSSVFIPDEMTLGELLGGDWSPARPNHGWKLGTFSPTSHSLEEGEGLAVELTIDHAYVIKPPQKSRQYGRVPGW